MPCVVGGCVTVLHCARACEISAVRASREDRRGGSRTARPAQYPHSLSLHIVPFARPLYAPRRSKAAAIHSSSYLAPERRRACGDEGTCPASSAVRSVNFGP